MPECAGVRCQCRRVQVGVGRIVSSTWVPCGDRTMVWRLSPCVLCIVCKTCHRVKPFLGVADAMIEAGCCARSYGATSSIMAFAGTTACSTGSVGGRKQPGGSGSAVAATRVRSAGSDSSSCERCSSCPDLKSFTRSDAVLRGSRVMRQSGAETLVTEEPYELIAHVRICGGAGWVTTGSTRKPDFMSQMTPQLLATKAMTSRDTVGL